MENRVILSKRNAHRVATVQNIEHPEWGVFQFMYKGKLISEGLMRNEYQDVICKEDFTENFYGPKYEEWEIVSYKYPVLLEEYDEQAYRAFYWSSFRPDERGIQTIKEHEAELNQDLEGIPAEEHERYISNYKKYFSAWLSAHSNCASSAVTGGSGFNTRKAEKANNSERNRMKEFIEWRERALKAIAKRIEKNKPESEKRAEEWQHLENDILHSAAVIHGINTGIERGYNKALFVSSIYNKVETYAKHGDTEIVEKAINTIRNFNETMSVVITERHKFFKLVEVAEANRETLEDRKEKENGVEEYDGLKVIYNYSADRLQLDFDEKPDEEIRNQLKREYAFRWNRFEGVWQRQLTSNAVYALKQFLQRNNLLVS